MEDPTLSLDGGQILLDNPDPSSPALSARGSPLVRLSGLTSPTSAPLSPDVAPHKAAGAVRPAHEEGWAWPDAATGTAVVEKAGAGGPISRVRSSSLPLNFDEAADAAAEFAAAELSAAPLPAVVVTVPDEASRTRSRSMSDPRLPLFSGQAPDQGMRHYYTPVKPARDKISSSFSAGIAVPAPIPETSQSASALAESVQLLRRSVYELLQQNTCYDMMPRSGKLVVLDTGLLVKKAFAALIQHGIRSAVLWESVSQQFIGMITITDFIQILFKYYKSPLVHMHEMEEYEIRTWRDLAEHPRQLKCIEPMTSLWEATAILVGRRIHRLPVIDTSSGNALNILTHKRILLFIWQHIDQSHPVFSQPIASLDIGTQRHVLTITEDMPLIKVLGIFVEKKISALPIVDAAGLLLGVYAKYDAISLAYDRSYTNLDVTVKEALMHRLSDEGVTTCTWASPLGQLLNDIFDKHLHRIVVIDDERKVVGIVSLSDLLSFLLALGFFSTGTSQPTAAAAFGADPAVTVAALLPEATAAVTGGAAPPTGHAPLHYVAAAATADVEKARHSFSVV